MPDAPAVFTDGSANGTAAYAFQGHSFPFPSPFRSAQLVELFAVLQVFQDFQDSPPYTDSAYIAPPIPLLETALFIKPTSNATPLFTQIQQKLRECSHPVFIGRIRAHGELPGPLTEGNALADTATRQVFPVLQEPILSASRAHRLHHLNAKTLRLKLKITKQQAREIVKQCPSCIVSHPVPHVGVNPRGLLPNMTWQMGVTHVPDFGRQEYLHVSVDTFSGFIFASPHTGEAVKDVITHLLVCFSTLGIPKHTKTDNGPAYTSEGLKRFLQQFEISHTTGIPYNPQGQGIVERAHQTLKTWLSRLKMSKLSFVSPRDRLSHALLVLNLLTLDGEGRSAADRHWHPAADTSRPLAM